jgi:hypothetical protein
MIVGGTLMEEQATQLTGKSTERESPVEDRQPWEQPKLERLHASLDTASSKGSGSDGGLATAPPPL